MVLGHLHLIKLVLFGLWHTILFVSVCSSVRISCPLWQFKHFLILPFNLSLHFLLCILVAFIMVLGTKIYITCHDLLRSVQCHFQWKAQTSLLLSGLFHVLTLKACQMVLCVISVSSDQIYFKKLRRRQTGFCLSRQALLFLCLHFWCSRIFLVSFPFCLNKFGFFFFSNQIYWQIILISLTP